MDLAWLGIFASGTQAQGGPVHFGGTSVQLVGEGPKADSAGKCLQRLDMQLTSTCNTTSEEKSAQSAIPLWRATTASSCHSAQ